MNSCRFLNCFLFFVSGFILTRVYINSKYLYFIHLTRKYLYKNHSSVPFSPNTATPTKHSPAHTCQITNNLYHLPIRHPHTQTSACTKIPVLHEQQIYLCHSCQTGVLHLKYYIYFFLHGHWIRNLLFFKNICSLRNAFNIFPSAYYLSQLI